MDVVLPFAAALVSLRLAADLLRRWRTRRAPELLAWAASLAAFAAASAALAWGAAAGWDDRAFRAYYLFGGLLTAPLLGAGSLLRARVSRTTPVALLYAGLAVGVAIAMPIDPSVAGTGIPDASDHLENDRDIVIVKFRQHQLDGAGARLVQHSRCVVARHR